MTTRKRGKWYLDSGCSRYMTGDAAKFVNPIQVDYGAVAFGGKG